MYNFDHILLSYYYNERCSSRTMKRKSKHAFYVQYVFLFFENRAVYEKMWENTVESGRPQMTIWRMRIAFWISKATHTYSEYVTLIAFSLQQ